MRVGLIYASHPRLCNPEDDRAPLGIGYLASYLRAHAPDVEVVIERDPDRLIEQSGSRWALLHDSRRDLRRPSGRAHARRTGRSHRRRGRAYFASADVPARGVRRGGSGRRESRRFWNWWSFIGRRSAWSRLRWRGSTGCSIAMRRAQLARTAARGLVKDLDQIPPPARDLLTAQWPASRRIASVLTGRGCPFNCVFCSTNRTGRGVVARKRRVRPVRDRGDPQRCAIPKRWKSRMICLSSTKRRVLGLLGKIRERGLHEGMTLSCSVRTGVVDEEIMDALAATNFRVLHAGLESGSDRVLEIFNKTNVTAEGNARCCGWGWSGGCSSRRASSGGARRAARGHSRHPLTS